MITNGPGVTVGGTLPLANSASPSAGSGTAVSAVNHVHPQDLWTPRDYGYATWTFDQTFASASTAPASGTMVLARLHNSITRTITSLELGILTAGVSLTAGQCFAALFKASDKSLLGVTGDQSAAWNAAGFKPMAIAGGPISVPAGDVLVGWWSNNTAGSNPAFARGAAGSGLPNGPLSGDNSRYGSANTGLTTTAPNPMGAITATNFAWWAALS